MVIWLDAQLPPSIASWIQDAFDISCQHVFDLGLLSVEDDEIFEKAKKEKNAVVMSKDSDFVELNLRYGAPPQIIWLTCGNTSNSNLRKILKTQLPVALKLLEEGNSLVEISD